MKFETKENIKDFFVRHWLIERRCNPSLTTIFFIILMFFTWWYFRGVHYELRVPESKVAEMQNATDHVAIHEHFKADDLVTEALKKDIDKENAIILHLLKKVARLDNITYQHGREIDYNIRKLEIIDKKVFNTEKEIQKEDAKK